MRVSYHIGVERIHSSCQLVRIHLRIHVQLLHQHVQLLMVYHSVLVCIHLFEYSRCHLYPLAVLAKDLLQSQVLELGGSQVA